VLYITAPTPGASISPTIENLYITGGDIEEGAGGGVYVYQAHVTFQGNDVCSNAAAHGGGLYLQHSDATLNGNTITSNTAHLEGGGLILSSSDATLNSNDVSFNTANDYGGGLWVEYSDAILDDNAISSNTADAGGGLYLHGSDMILGDNIILSNFADTGGGLYLRYSDATLDGNSILSNHAREDGGGLYLNCSNVSLNGNTIAANRASYGGGLYMRSGSSWDERYPITWTNNVIADNWADVSGSGLHIQRPWLRLLHTTIARNSTGSDGDGSGVYIAGKDDFASYSTVNLINTILVSHTVGVIVTEGNTVTLEATLWGAGSAGFSDWGGEGTISSKLDVWGDPALRCAGSACITPYHIGPGSAALDAGVEIGVMTDVDGEPRPYRLPDLGADEYWPPGALKLVYLPLVVR
jgi:hypothetical protein